ncbi:MAG: FecCD family ABC transporter permease [Brevinema sp.]
MKKPGVFLALWIILSACYIFPQSSGGILSLRLNLWAQMNITAFILAGSGAVLQILLRNPLADPWLLGVTGASSLGAVLASFFALAPIILWRTGFSLVGSFFCIIFLFYAGRKHRAELLILMGVGINALCSALIVLVQGLLSPNNLAVSFMRISGHFSERSLGERILLLPAIVSVSFILVRFRKELFILAGGELSAQSVGIDTKKISRLCIVVISFAVALVSGLAGMIGFIGLAVPHIIRRFLGFEHVLDLEYLIPISGSLIMLGALAARLIPAGVFVPLGSVLALFGAPFFIVVLYRSYQ